jgi:hypothetical protein
MCLVERCHGAGALQGREGFFLDNQVLSRSGADAIQSCPMQRARGVSSGIQVTPDAVASKQGEGGRVGPRGTEA